MNQPLYQKLFKDIKSQIIAGIYKEGDVLPSENDLAKVHQVTRATVRQSLGELVNEGYIEKKQGVGSIVTKPGRKTIGLLSVKGFSKAVGEKKQKVRTTMLQNPSVMVWDDDFFYPISEIEKSAGCIYLQRVRFVGNDPVMLEDTYISNLNIPKFCKSPFSNGSLFETLNVKYQIEITKVEQDMRAVLADEISAVILNTTTGVPLLRTYMKFYTSRENLFVYSTLLCNTGKYSVGNIL